MVIEPCPWGEINVPHVIFEFIRIFASVELIELDFFLFCLAKFGFLRRTILLVHAVHIVSLDLPEHGRTIHRFLGCLLCRTLRFQFRNDFVTLSIQNIVWVPQVIHYEAFNRGTLLFECSGKRETLDMIPTARTSEGRIR